VDAAEVLAWRTRSRIDSAAAAAYHPWLEVGDPASGTTTVVPPSGHAAGIWARVDNRGSPVRAPTAEALLATDGAASGLTAAEQHRLNRAGLNCLRAWPGPELRAWGACTLSRDPELRYLHHQRIVGHLIGSIAQGTRWAAEQPNAERLHEQLRATITSFLTHAWRAGALQGDTPAQAFHVRCDAELNDESAQARGEVVVEVGLAVRRPGDYRVLRIAHRDSDA
jgi:phage tail sheath protein FI